MKYFNDIAVNAYRPWSAPDSRAELLAIRTWDSQEKIDICLNCTKPTCTNCHANNAAEREAREDRRERLRSAIRAVCDGSAVSVVCVEFGIPRRTIYNHLKQIRQKERDNTTN